MTDPDKIALLEREVAALRTERDELVDHARELLTIKAEVNEHWGSQMDGRDRWPARLFRLLSNLRDQAERAEARTVGAMADVARLAKTMSDASTALHVIRDAYLEAKPGSPEPTPLDLVGWVADAQPRSQKAWASELVQYLCEYGVDAVLAEDGETVSVHSPFFGDAGDALLLVPTNGDKVIITIPDQGVALCRTTDEVLSGVLGVMAAFCDPKDLS